MYVNVHTSADPHQWAAQLWVGNQDGLGSITLLAHQKAQAPQEPSLIHSLTVQEAVLSSVL